MTAGDFTFFSRNEQREGPRYRTVYQISNYLLQFQQITYIKRH